MKWMRNLLGLALAAGTALSLAVPAFAADYSFSTAAPQNYYGSTSYEDVYGSQYNYGGRNVTDYDLSELEYGRPSTTMTGEMEQVILPGLQGTAAVDGNGGYGIGSYGIGGPLDGTGGPSVLPALPDIQQPVYTSVSGMVRADGSIGTLKIPKLGINMKVWEGETNASMAKGLGHYSSTSGWSGNIGVCGHNRGAKYNIGAIKNLVAGDIITYTTIYGTRTYQVTMVKIIANTDWSYLQGTADNRITITTCLENQPAKRICVQAVEKSS